MSMLIAIHKQQSVPCQHATGAPPAADASVAAAQAALETLAEQQSTRRVPLFSVQHVLQMLEPAEGGGGELEGLQHSSQTASSRWAATISVLARFLLTVPGCLHCCMTMCCLNGCVAGLRHEVALGLLGVPLLKTRAAAACRHPWGILGCLWQTRSGCLLVLADHEPALSAWAAVCMQASKVLAALPHSLSGSVSRDEACSCGRALGLLGRQHAGGELPSNTCICLCFQSAVPSAQACVAAGICAHALLPKMPSSRPNFAVSQGTLCLHTKSG